MSRTEKVAIARIFADLIKADRIVDMGEVDFWRNICRKYSIDRDVRIEAGAMPLDEAIGAIAKVRGLREDLIGDCRGMTVSDGFCAHSEALLMMALTSVLESGTNTPGVVYSIPRSEFNIDIATALYIENEYDPDTNDAILNNYRAIYKEFQLAGFHFIYIPKIIEHYRDTDPELFKEILSFLAPGLSDNGLDSAHRALMKMTTGGFCKDLLCNKCGIEELRSTNPSLLIKISNSYVGDDQYANYLKLEVDENILETVQTFVDTFTGMMSSDIYVVKASEERANQFHFHGFYQQLLNIFLVRRNIRSSILLDPWREEIRFPDIDSTPTGLHRRERALYALLLCYGSDGINFSKPRTAAEMSRYELRMKRMQKRYAAIYSMFGGTESGAPDLTIPEIRRPIVSCLRSSIRKLNGLYNPEDYNISGKDGILAIHIETELVFVNQRDYPEPVPLKDSELYRRFYAR